MQQLALQVLGGLLAPDEAETAPPEPPAKDEPSEERERRRSAGRRPIPPELPRITVEVLPPEVQREGLDAFERIGEEVSEVIERCPDVRRARRRPMPEVLEWCSTLPSGDAIPRPELVSVRARVGGMSG